ncbi:hypothetical protein VM1G_09660 [Cytospora mali]|uniref:Uncharacterized protein n=1 Tax=Cytospora mali TaxID=578113 RepID=A0A194WDZ2_CYTMA|nr:hypothetical protein VM1G_09660 [Valsa mali]
MSEEPDIFVSNGTCYLGPSLESGGAMIPCGNDYFGHIACCQAGDYCLESSVCFNSRYQVTYIAGCTDRHYLDDSCPIKFEDTEFFKLPETPWLGMSYCNGTSDEWVVCDQKAHPSTLTSPEQCYCPTATAERSIIISHMNQIPAVAILPITLGGSIDFFTGHFPTAPDTMTTATGAAATTFSSSMFTPTFTTTRSPVSTSDNTSPLQSEQGFNKTDKIGTAVGTAVFGLIALTSLGYFLLSL